MKSTMNRLFLGCLSALAFNSAALANMADPRPYLFAQPDGNEFKVVQRGDERGMWLETTEGYTVDQGPDGYWYYVRGIQDGEVQRTRRLAHLSLTKKLDLDPHINPHINIGDALPPWFYSGAFDESRLLKGRSRTKVLIIAVEFLDQSNTYDESVWAERIWSSNPDAKTIASYYDAASYGVATLTPADETSGIVNDGVIGPVLINMNHPNTGVLSVLTAYPVHDQIYQEAIDAADPFIDYAVFDANKDYVVDSSELAIIIVTAGNHKQGSVQIPSISAHTSPFDGGLNIIDDLAPDGTIIALAQAYAMVGERTDDTWSAGDSIPSTLGVFVHELGHLVYGLPDLYDVDGAINGSSAGIGAYGLMGSGAHGLDYDVDLYSGQTPVLPTAWSQYKLDWVSASSNFWATGLTTAGRSSIPTTQPKVGIAHMGFDPGTGAIQCDDKEYFLMQYRTAEGYDRGLTAVHDLDGTEHAGVVIYHVDERQSDNNTALLKLLDVEDVQRSGCGSSGGQSLSTLERG